MSDYVFISPIVSCVFITLPILSFNIKGANDVVFVATQLQPITMLAS